MCRKSSAVIMAFDDVGGEHLGKEEGKKESSPWEYVKRTCRGTQAASTISHGYFSREFWRVVAEDRGRAVASSQASPDERRWWRTQILVDAIVLKFPVTEVRPRPCPLRGSRRRDGLLDRRDSVTRQYVNATRFRWHRCNYRSLVYRFGFTWLEFKGYRDAGNLRKLTVEENNSVKISKDTFSVWTQVKESW